MKSDSSGSCMNKVDWSDTSAVPTPSIAFGFLRAKCARFVPLLAYLTRNALVAAIALTLASSARAALPVDQTLSPEGVSVLLPGLKPRAIALSPDHRLLVTSGANLVVMDAVTGNVRQHIPFPAEEQSVNEAGGAPPDFQLGLVTKTQSSFCGLPFLPPGDRNFFFGEGGTIKIFLVDAAGQV